MQLKRNPQVFGVWSLFAFYCFLVVLSSVNSTIIVAQDLYTDSNTPPFTISVSYKNTAASPITMTCKTNNQDSGISASSVELSPSTGSDQTVSVEFTGTLNIELPVEISCSIGEETEAVTNAIIAHSDNRLAVCNFDEVYPESGTNDVNLHLYSGNEGITVDTADCSCLDDSNTPILNKFQLVTDTKFELTATRTAGCPLSEAFCSCTFKCTYGSNLSISRKIRVLNPVLYITSSFETLSFYKNTSTVSTYTFPPSTEIKCFANQVTLDSNTFVAGEIVEDSSFADLVLEKLSSGVFHVFPRDSNVASGVYGIKCSSGSATDTFFFELDNSEPSSISGEKVNFDEYVSVQCSCDVTPAFCDARCCCDSDCSDLQKESFQSCIQGPTGGDHTMKIKPSCSDVSNVSPWERALCIKTSNSAFLGSYFNFVNKRSSPSSFTAENVWRDSNIARVSSNPTSKSTKGYPVFIRSPFDENSYGLLTLPGKVGGSCVSAKPLKLLENSHTVCSRVITENCNMELGGPFNALSYLSPTESIVDPCKRFAHVYSNGVDSSDALIKVVYKKEEKILNNIASEILEDQTCEHAVTDVTYQISVSSGTIVLITATLVLQDLSGNVGETIATSYRVEYVSADVESLKSKEVSSNVGYNRHDFLFLSSGKLKLPQYGNCDDISNTGTVPKFGVSTITQCYKTVTNDIKQNCTELYKILETSYSEFIQNNSMIGSTPGNKLEIPTIQTNPLKRTNLTETELCDHLPSHLHILIFHKKSSVSGEEITNVTFSFQYGSPGQLAGGKVVLQADLRFLMSDLSEKRSSLSWQDIAEFFENRQELLNSLIVLFAALIYFAIPKNILSSKL